MADLNAIVKKVDYINIKTDKGKLTIPLTYLDVPLNIGDSLRVNVWHPYTKNVSVLAMGENITRYTDFFTNDKKINGYRRTLNDTLNDYVISCNDGDYINLNTYQLPTDNTVLLTSNEFFIGTNGIAISKSIAKTYNIKRDNVVISSYPSNYGFGVCLASDYETAFYTNTITENDIKLANIILGISDYTPPDPYNGGGNTTDGGGGGTFGGGNTIFGGASDSIDIPKLPTASASSAGFITLFNPSLAQLNNLANYMWSDLFSLDTFKKIFADPMDCILGLSIVPVKPASAGTSNVKIGNVSTDVAMNKTSSQYVAVDCGTIDVKEYWGAYLDYAPYTQCEIYLPYVGTKQISVDDVMNKAVHVVYHVDILSGACNAYVKCGNSVLYTFVGQCSSSIPISGNDWTNVLNGAISVAGKIGLAMATGGATALMSGLGAASSIISSSKPTVERSGAMSSTGGLLGIQKPYLILTRPKQALPENQNKYTGYPSFITMSLSDCTGYTEIESIHLENMSCTDEEAQEIENLLKSGVIF